MVCKTKSATITGVDAQMVNVEADISDGLPSFDMVGLLSSEIKESRERVRTAIKNSAITLPAKRITINLSPADLRKTGSYFDLPIAVSILCAMGILPIKSVAVALLMGELSLDGSILRVIGVLTILLICIEENIKKFYVPYENVREACIIPGISVYGVSSIGELLLSLSDDERKIDACTCDENVSVRFNRNPEHDFGNIIGQAGAKRAAEIAAAGMHNLLLMGVPGSGKSMIAKCIPGIMPEMSDEECLDVWKIYSVAGLLKDDGLSTERPFRSPHHTATCKALIGGGFYPKPGEVTLAHRGVLFLDEFPEFSREVIESLRQPLEDGYTVVSRTNGTYKFPAEFMLVAAMNNCKCGYYPDRSRCRCSQYEIDRYLSKLSGPILDRIDICTSTTEEKYKTIYEKTGEESSEAIRKRVKQAVEIQKERYIGTNIKFNSELDGENIKKYCRLGKKENDLMEQIFNKMKLSFRGYFKILKTARTICDLSGEKEIKEKHIIEAVSYRPPEYIGSKGR